MWTKRDVHPRQRSGRNRPLAERSREWEGGAERFDHDAAEIHRGKMAKTELRIQENKEIDFKPERIREWNHFHSDNVTRGNCCYLSRHTPDDCFQELSQEKKRTLELLGVKDKEEKHTEAAGETPACEDGGDVDLLKDLQHIEEEMKVLLKEKEQAEEKWEKLLVILHTEVMNCVLRIIMVTVEGRRLRVENVYWSPQHQCIDQQQ